MEKNTKVNYKGKFAPVLSYYALKTYILLNLAPRHDDALGEWRYISTRS